MQEREISIVDLLIEILLRWRVLVAWMLIGGLLMGGLSYVRSYRTAQEQKAQIAEMEKKLSEKKEQLQEEEQGNNDGLAEREYLREQLTEVQENNINTVLNYDSFIEEREAYCNSSVLMQIDPLNISQGELTFLIASSDIDKSNSIARVYEDMIPGGLSQWIADNSEDNISTAVLGELILVSRSSRSLMMGSDSFCVTILHSTEEQCKELAKEVIAYLNQQQKSVQEQMGSHEIKLVNEAYSVIADTSLMDKQRVYKGDIIAWNTNAARLKEAFTEEEWKYYNFLTMGKAQGIPEKYEKEEDDVEVKQEEQVGGLEVTAIATPSVSIKYVILGMILLTFIYVFYVFLTFVMNNKLRTEDNVRRIYGVPQLGRIPKNDVKKKLFAFVDSWILKLRDRNKRKFSEEEAIGLAGVAVKISAKKEELHSVYCIGCNMKGKTVEISDKIQSILKAESIDMTVLNNVLYNQESMEQLEGAKGAFLLEKAGETLYDEIAKELELLNRQGVKILGIITVE